MQETGARPRHESELRQAVINGLELLRAGQTDQAAATFLGVLRQDPEHPTASLNLARALVMGRRFGAAAMAAGMALALQPDAAEPHFLLGTALNGLGRPDEALDALARAVAIDPSLAAAWLNRGNACADLDRLEEAERHIRRALAEAPGLIEAHVSLGFVLTSLGRLDEARAACAAAITLAPDCAQAHWNLATAALLAGDFATGFCEYEWRKRHDSFRCDFLDLPGPVWDGGRLEERRLLIQAEQGLGDTIQLSRYVPLIAARGLRVTLACDRRLIPLLRTTPGLAAAIDRTEPLPPYDAWIDQMSLLRVFETTPDTIPAPQGWLAADCAGIARFRELTGSGRRVGIVWAGNPAHSNDRRRSLPAESVAALAAETGAGLVSLQVGPRAGEAAQYGFLDLSGRLHDYAETASAIAALDLLITVDTSVAHVAGALGKPVWVMLPFAPDWRWVLGRDTTPWYASMRLFRQSRPGDWGDVVRQVAQAFAVWRSTDQG